MSTSVWSKQVDFDNNSSTNAAWEARRKYFGKRDTTLQKINETNFHFLGDYVTKKNETTNVEEQKFTYSSRATFLIGEISHFLPPCSYLSNLDITVDMDLASPAYCFSGKYSLRV